MTYTRFIPKEHTMTTTEQFPLVSEIIAYERGEMDYDEPRLIALFQYLVDTGQAWTLQGHYGNTATNLIYAGLVTRPRKLHARWEQHLIDTRRGPRLHNGFRAELFDPTTGQHAEYLCNHHHLNAATALKCGQSVLDKRSK
jgi:hypothetical protein